MPTIVLTLLQGLLLLLLYVFIGRAVRAVVRDLRGTTPAPRPQRADRTAAGQAAPGGSAARQPRRQGRGDRERVAPGQLVVHVAEGRPKVLPLDTTAVTFGRSTNTTVRLDDPYVSDRHARVHQQDGTWVITDLGSTNGTFVNQVKITAPTPIAAGDQLGIGRTVVEVRK